MKTIELLLPAYFASLFINADESGYESEDINAVEVLTNKYLSDPENDCFLCVGADVDNTYFSPQNDMPTMRNLGADVCTFTFQIEF